MGELELQRLKVSANGRFLIQEDGSPFYWLGDTAWELFARLEGNAYGRYPLRLDAHGIPDPLQPDLSGDFRIGRMSIMWFNKQTRTACMSRCFRLGGIGSIDGLMTMCRKSLRQTTHMLTGNGSANDTSPCLVSSGYLAATVRSRLGGISTSLTRWRRGYRKETGAPI